MSTGQEIVRAGRVPPPLVRRTRPSARRCRASCRPAGVYNHISGIDLVRTAPDQFYVLEDNARTPSGVSYMLENREAMLRLFPKLFARHRVAAVNRYPEELLKTLRASAPRKAGADPTVAILTPGQFNSAYYEHCFLADEMGVEVVEGADLFVEDDTVFHAHHRGPATGGRAVSAHRRRLPGPAGLQPRQPAGRAGPDGCLPRRQRHPGQCAGRGIADDKAIYPFVPEMIRFYLGEEPLLQNVPTYLCERDDDRAHVLANIGELVVKLARGSGGYGMLVGPHSTAAQREEFAARIKARPHDYIAQPTLALSTVPTLAEAAIAPRHVDLRPYVLMGKEVRIVPAA
jgi:uncharacterized circularly permuted ATP-grasp superfamily protein